MERRKAETFYEYLGRLSEVAKTMTQEQVDVCAWMMGGHGCGWTPEVLSKELLREQQKARA